MVLHHQGPVDGAPLRLEEIPVPLPGPHDLVVRVEACGICRTDLHVVEGDLPPAKMPIIPGHQIVGRAVRLGAEVASLKEGGRRPHRP